MKKELIPSKCASNLFLWLYFNCSLHTLFISEDCCILVCDAL